MKNPDFFFEQYNKINWTNQDKNHLNEPVSEFVIDEIIAKIEKPFNLFEIGSGIGFFIKMLINKFGQDISISGCEPAEKSYNYFIQNNKYENVDVHNETFQNIKIDKKFDVITAIYVFPHFIEKDLIPVIKKIYEMLNDNGKFIMVVSNEVYLRNKLDTHKDLFIEQNIVKFKDKEYKEYLHYVDIPDMGTVIDYDREENYYQDIFEDCGFKLEKKDVRDSSGYLCTVFTFAKS
jgi:cyclopropane fatty-acyl-phospholipid synthase-like methyltransferase